MKKIVDSILETIGNTPLVKLNSYDRSEGTVADIYAKVEAFNPGGSNFICPSTGERQGQKEGVGG